MTRSRRPRHEAVKGLVVDVVRQGPGEGGHLGPAEVFGDGGPGHADALGDLPIAEVDDVLERSTSLTLRMDTLVAGIVVSSVEEETDDRPR